MAEVLTRFRNVVVVEDGGVKRVVYKLQPRQNEAFRLTPLDRARGESYPKHIGYGGAAGGGKSHLARAVGCVAALLWPRSTGIIFRRTKAEVKSNHVSKFLLEVPRKLESGAPFYSYNGEDMCAQFENGSRIYFGYLKEFSDVDRYQGNEYDWMVFEEATHYAWDTVRWLTGNRLRATTKESRPFVLYPSNPGNVGHHWYKRLFIDRKYNPELDEQPENYAFVQAKVTDNKVLVDRDPSYLRELNTLPEPFRSWLRDGDFEAGLGLALTMLRRERHFVDPFVPPDHWPVFGAFDWGYEHPWVYGWYTVDEDGRYVKGDSLSGRRQEPREIVASIKAGLERRGVDYRRVRFTDAGHDCWADRRARAENVPTIAEVFADEGLPIRQASISRVAGLNNLRLHLGWEGLGPDGEDVVPNLRFMRTPGNDRCFTQLESLPVDPDNPEDALKSDADVFGQGGDDYYDETRYALASRAPRAHSRFMTTAVSCFDPAMLELEWSRNRTGRLPKQFTRPRYLHPEFGEQV